MRNYEKVFDVNNIVNRGISGDITDGILKKTIIQIGYVRYGERIKR